MVAQQKEKEEKERIRREEEERKRLEEQRRREEEERKIREEEERRRAEEEARKKIGNYFQKIESRERRFYCWIVHLWVFSNFQVSIFEIKQPLSRFSEDNEETYPEFIF